eukprot:5166819-Amphidinium_carterae.2
MVFSLKRSVQSRVLMRSRLSADSTSDDGSYSSDRPDSEHSLGAHSRHSGFYISRTDRWAVTAGEVSLSANSVG